MLTLFKERGWLKSRQSQRTDSTHVLAKVRAINRLMCVGEAMRFARGSLAIVAGEWRAASVATLPGSIAMGTELKKAVFEDGQAERQAVAEVIGRDGFFLLEEIYAPTAPPLLRDVPAVELLRQIWIQNYSYEEGQVRWREPENIPAATQFINSPYDPEAHLGKKRSTMWTGYKIHLSETCDENLPHLITHVATTPAPRTDEAMTDSIHTGLQQADVLPSVHLMDSGYVTSQTLVSSQRRIAG